MHASRYAVNHIHFLGNEIDKLEANNNYSIFRIVMN